MLKKILLAILLSVFFVGTANAWYIELGTPYNSGNTYVDVIWQGGGGAVNLNTAAIGVPNAAK